MSSKLNLGEISIFSALTPVELEILSDVARERHYASGEKIFEKDDTGASMFVIVEGRVKIMLPDDDHADVELSVLGRGDFFGEMSLFDDAPRSATVRAESDTIVIEIARAPFLLQVASNPDISLKILSVMTKRIRQSDDRVHDFANRVMQEAAPRVEEAIVSRLEAAEVMYAKTEDHASRVVAHVDRTWTALVRVGSVGMLFAGVVGLGLGVVGYNELADVRVNINQAVTEARASSDQAKAELADIQDIRRAALQGRTASTIVVEIDKIRRDFGLDGNQQPTPERLRKLAPVFSEAEKQLLALIAPTRRSDKDQTSPEYAQAAEGSKTVVDPQSMHEDAKVAIEAAATYTELISQMQYRPVKSKLTTITESILGFLNLPAADWRTRLKARRVLVDLASSSEHAGDIVYSRLKDYLQGSAIRENSKRDVVEMLFDIRPDDTKPNEQAREILIDTMSQGRSPWSRIGAATQLVNIGYKPAWELLHVQLQAMNKDSFIAAYLIASDLGASNLHELGICGDGIDKDDEDPIELIQSRLKSQIALEDHQTTNPYQLAYARYLLDELRDVALCDRN